MKFAVLFFGAGAFLLVMAVGLSAARDFELVLRDAALACLGAAWVGRWFWRRLESAFAQTLAARREAALAEETPEPASASASRPSPSPKPSPASAASGARRPAAL